jgi:uncharacterized lipoprotein YajG
MINSTQRWAVPTLLALLVLTGCGADKQAAAPKNPTSALPGGGVGAFKELSGATCTDQAGTWHFAGTLTNGSAKSVQVSVVAKKTYSVHAAQTITKTLAAGQVVPISADISVADAKDHKVICVQTVSKIPHG